MLYWLQAVLPVLLLGLPSSVQGEALGAHCLQLGKVWGKQFIPILACAGKPGNEARLAKSI